MPKESDSGRDYGLSGGSGPISDSQLASEFIKANRDSLISEDTSITDLFKDSADSKPESLQIIQDFVPDPELLKELDESLTNKDVHHKRLLDDDYVSNVFYRLFKKLVASIQIPVRKTNDVAIYSLPARLFSYFCSFHRKDTKSFLLNFNSLTDLHLRGDSTRFKLLKREAYFTLMLIIISSVIIGLFSGLSHKNSIYTNWTSCIISFSTISLVLTLLPIFFFASLWFVNVNHLHTSRNFHYLLFVMYTLAFIFVSLSVMNSLLYWLLGFFFDF